MQQKKLNQLEKAGAFNSLVSMLLLTILLLIIFSKLSAQDKLIGFNSEQNYTSRGNTYQINTDGSNYQINAKFPWINGGFTIEVVDGNDGYIYGINGGDGYSFAGSVFRVKYNGDAYQDLKVFNRSSDGGSCRYRPALGADGYIYGVNEGGGINNRGTVWKVRRDGTDFSVIYHFPASVGATIYAGIGGDFNHTGMSGSATFGLDGRLYIFCDGGSYGGHIFRINTDGTGFSMLFHTTANVTTPGTGIRGPLTLGSDGFFYGCFVSGGNFSSRIGAGAGVAFKFNPYTSTYTPLHLFAANANEGTWPMAVQEGPGGFLYGACYNSGIPNGIETDHGTVWKLSKDGSSFTVLKQLEAVTTGNGIEHKLIAGPNGKIYFSTHNNGISGAIGTTGCLMSINPDGTDFRIIRSTFEGLAAPASMFYRVDETGAKFYGIGSSTATYLFKLDSSGSNYENIIGFGMNNYGANPMNKPLVINNSSSLNRNIIGIAPNQGFDYGGIIFKYNPDALSNSVSDVISGMRNVGAGARGTVNGNFTPLLASDGFLYGQYSYYTSGSFSGTEAIYKLSTNNRSQPITIKTFSNTGIGVTNCSQISSGLIELPDGFIYGTTASGGNNFNGAIFKVRKDGSGYTNIYHFTTYRDKNTLVYDGVDNKIICASSRGFIAMNSDGSSVSNIPFSYAANYGIVLQGNTIYGIYGSGSSWGIFKMNKSGSGFTSLRTFSGTSEGYYPNMEITLDNTNKIYGTTIYGGSFGEGVLYKIDTDGNNFTILKHFSRADGGGIPGPVSFRPCTAPNNATNITFSNSTNNSITLSEFTAPETGANGYVIKMNTVNVFTDLVDGTNPTASTTYTSGQQVIYNGSSIPTSLIIDGLTENTVYYFKVYAYGCTARLYSNTNTTGNPAQYRTRVSLITRIAGRMLQSNGINQYANAGDVNATEGNNALSFGCWFKPNAFPATGLTQQSIISKGDGVNAATTSYFIKMYKDEVDASVKLSAGISIDGVMSPLNVTTSPTDFGINKWTHVFVCWESGSTIRLYINGKLAAQSLTPVTGIVNNITQDLRFASSTATSEQSFNGNIEEAAIYNSLLTICDVRQRMHNTLTGSEAGLISYYQFNDAITSPSFIDAIGGFNAARINGVTNPLSNLAVAGGNAFCDAAYVTNLNQTFRAFDSSNSFQLNFPSDVPNGEISVSYLENNPVTGLPVAGVNVINGYWIVNNFGNNNTNLNATIALRLPDGTITDTDVSHYILFKRASASFGTWTSYPITSINNTTGNNLIVVAGINDFSQFLLMNTFVLAPPTVSIISTNFNICAGSNSMIIATATNAGSSPIYNFMVNGVSVQNSTSNTYSSTTFNNNDAVTCVVMDGTRTATSNTVIYTVRAIPTVAAITGTTTNCSIGSTTTLNCATAGGTWLSYNGTIASVSSTGRVTALANGSARIGYSITNSSGCSAESNIIYNVNQITTLPIITGLSNVCIGSSIALNSSILGGVWTSIAGRANVNGSGIVTGISIGTANIVYTISNVLGCTASSNILINVNALPSIPSIAYATGITSPQCGVNLRLGRTFGLVGNPTGGTWSSTNTAVISINPTTGITSTVGLGTATVSYTITNSNGCSNSRSITKNVVVCSSKGVLQNNENKASSFIVYPNPAKSIINIKPNSIYDDGKILVTDLLGKTLIQKSLNSDNNSIDVSALAKGVYFISVVTNNSIETKKIVKE